MKVFQEDRKWKKRFFSRPMLSLLALFLTVVLVSALRVSYRAYIAYGERADAEEVLKATKRQQAELEERIKSLQNPVGLEKEAKERFNVKSPGEEVIVIINPKQSTSTDDLEAGAVGLWRLLKSFFE